MAPLRTSTFQFLVLASAIVVSTTAQLSNIKNVVVLVQENR